MTPRRPRGDRVLPGRVRRNSPGAPLPREDAGALAPAVPVIALMLFLLVGLVVDSARQLDARSRAVAYAEEAARAGADRIDLNLEDAVVDPVGARRAVEDYCASVRAVDAAIVECGVVAVDLERVAVRVRMSTPAAMLSAVGVGPLEAIGEGEAIPQQGVTGVDEYPDVPPPSVTVTQVPLPVPVGEPNPNPTRTEAPPPSPTPSGSPSPSGSPEPSGEPTPTPSGSPDPDSGESS